MIRGRKEGASYATWFIGFDHDDTFGLTPFSELGSQSSLRTSGQDKPVSRAVSLESLVSQRSLAPAATQTSDDLAKAIPAHASTTTDTQTETFGLTQTEVQTDSASRGVTQTEVQTDFLRTSGQGSLTRSRTSTETSTGTDEHDGIQRSRKSSSARPRSYDFDLDRSKRKRDKDTQGIYKEAFDGARRAEEFKFRVKFDQLLVELHQEVEEKNPDGLTTSFASPSYGEVMLNFRGKVKDLLKGFTERLALAYDSFGSVDSVENTAQKVKQDVSKCIEDLIGESLELTSDEAVSDLSSLSDESIPDQNSFEDLIAQAVVSKLLENHRKEVRKALNLSGLSTLPDRKSHPHSDSPDLKSHRHSDSAKTHKQNSENDDVVRHGQSGIVNGHRRSSKQGSASSLSNPDLFNYRSDLIADSSSDENEEGEDVVDRNSYSKRKSKAEDKQNKVVSNGLSEKDTDRDIIADVHSEENTVTCENDIEKDFEELKEFVRKTQSSARPRVEAIEFDDANLCEAKEEPLARLTVDRDESREDFLTRYSVFDRVRNAEQDFSQFENIDFSSSELDPDLLSMNLEIIPEETEEELEQEDEEGKWRTNWIFKGKGASPYQKMGKKTVSLASEGHGTVYMPVPRLDDSYTPKIGNRDVDQLSDFSDHDPLSRSDLDGSDEDENTFYANTSKELARISGRQRKQYGSKSRSSGNHSDDSDFDARSSRRKPLGLYDGNSLDHLDGYDNSTNHSSGPVVEQPRQEVKLLQDLVPSENDDPKFLTPPESVTIQEGEPVKFSCRVGGTPPFDVFWYREGDEVEELEDSEDVEITSNGDKHSITLYNIGKAMAGQYMCIALSEKGKAIQYLVVTVKDNKQELKKPEFLKGLKDVDVTEGQSVKFRVKVKGYPQPRISWYKDGNLLKNSKACRIEKFGNRDYILTIDYATMNDDAEYTVSARNVAGEVKLSAQVIVEPQSDLPVRRQRPPSLTTSGASDSDSDRPSSLYKFRTTDSRLASTPLSPSPLSTKSSMQQRENQLHINHLDRRVNLTQKRVEEEAKKMQVDAQRVDAPSNQRLLSDNALEILATAGEIIKQETTPPASSSSSEAKVQNSNGTPNNTTCVLTGSVENSLGDFILPDTLDDFPLPSLPSSKAAPVKSTFELSLPNRTAKTKTDFIIDSSLSPRAKLEQEKFKPETSLSKHSSYNYSKAATQDLHKLSPRDINQNDTNINNLSFDSGKGTSLQDSSTSLASSVSSSASSKDYGDSDVDRHQGPSFKGQYTRDFEVPKAPEKKKWSVTLDPYLPQAEIVNKQPSDVVNKQAFTNKTPVIAINTPDLSPSNSIRSSKGDNSSQSSSPRQSIDSGVSVSSKLERPAAVHMVGHTSEDEVPESRTEFNTDGSIELPSVNKLRAMFSNTKDDDLGDGNFKRIHSITARSVPKGQLEKLRASNQKTAATAPPAAVSSNFLEVPGPAQASSAILQLNTSVTATSSKLTLKPLPASSACSTSSTQQQSQASTSGTYLDIKPDRDPVLIYPETDPDYMQRHLQYESHQQVPNPQTSNAKPASTKTSRAPQPPNEASPVTDQPTKLLVRAAKPTDNTETKKSGPRIKTGCISARAAFWERKMIDGATVDDNEFPEMVEDGDS
ncbi:unnamed protein product [Lymnaea stagnalis]|uniref:Ig-like domain-containing protein n=1 Tax=Lymnaea stagnalis TaxID=6523 RepID=A0AAV2HIA2_LYMST